MKTYLRHKIRNVIDIRELSALEMLDFEGKYRNYTEAHDFWEICYVIRGRIRLKLEDHTYSLNTKELILIAPNQKHRYISEDGNQNKAFVVCFDSFSQALEAISGFVFPAQTLQIGCMERIMEESRLTFCTDEQDLLAVLDQPRFGGQQALLLQLEYLLISLVRRLSEEKDPNIEFISDENFRADLVGAIQRFLRENLNKKLSLDVICARFSYSRSFLCKTFKEETGETLITCFNRLKMEEAKRLLKQTSLPVTDVAVRLGFQEVKYFDSLFKKHFGTTPVHYRKNADQL